MVKGIRDRTNAVQPGGGAPVAFGPAANTAPSGWMQYRQIDGLYSVKLPMSYPALDPGQMARMKPFGDDQLSTVIAHNGKVKCDIEVRQFSPTNLARHKELDRQLGPKTFAPDAVRRQVNWGGRVAIEDFDPKDPHGRTRRTYFDGHRMFKFTVSGFLRPLADEDRATFFDSVVFDPPN